MALSVVEEDLLEEIPLPTVPVTEADTFVPLLEADELLIPDLDAGFAEEVLLPDLPDTADDLDFELDSCVEILTDVPVLTDKLDEVFAVSLLHATPMQRRLEELETDVVLFTETFGIDQGFSVSLLHGYRPQ